MYLIAQMWGSVLVAVLAGLALGYGMCQWNARRRERSRVASVREDAMADLTQLRGDLEDTRAWHGRELSELRSEHEAALADQARIHRDELRVMQAAHEAQAAALQCRLDAAEAQARRGEATEAQARADEQTRQQASETALGAAQVEQARMAEELESLRTQVAALQDQRRADTAAWMARIRASSETAAANDVQAQGRIERVVSERRELEAQLQAAREREGALAEQVRRFNQSSEVIRRAQLDSFQARQAALGESAQAGQVLADMQAQIQDADNARALALAAREEVEQQLAQAQQTFDALSDDLREQLDASRQTLAHAVRASEAREARLSMDIIELRAELERLRRERAESSRRSVGLHRPSRLALLEVGDVARLVDAAGAGRPPQAAAPQGQMPDDLTAIDGVDAATESWLHGMGILFYWQIASWTAEEVAWVSQHLPARGEAVWQRNWMSQCARLSAKEGLHVE